MVGAYLQTPPAACYLYMSQCIYYNSCPKLCQVRTEVRFASAPQLWSVASPQPIPGRPAHGRYDRDLAWALITERGCVGGRVHFAFDGGALATGVGIGHRPRGRGASPHHGASASVIGSRQEARKTSAARQQGCSWSRGSRDVHPEAPNSGSAQAPDWAPTGGCCGGRER